MNFELKELVQDAVETVRDPRAGARKVMAVKMTRQQRWEVLLLIVVLSVLLATVSLNLGGGGGGIVVGGPDLQNPLGLGGVQMFVLFTMALGIYWIGKRAGGRGSLDDSILLVAWLQFILICLQVIQTIALVLVPPLGSLIGLVGLVLFFWLLTNFVSELHGFQSLGSVFVSILMALVGFAILLSIVMGILGVQIVGV